MKYLKGLLILKTLIRGHDESWKRSVMTALFGSMCLPNTMGDPLAAIVTLPPVSEVHSDFNI